MDKVASASWDKKQTHVVVGKACALVISFNLSYYLLNGKDDLFVCQNQIFYIFNLT